MKRIICLLIVLTLFFILVIHASAKTTERMELKVITDTTKVRPGDIVTFSVVMGPVSEVGSIQLRIVLPEGLSYVKGSGKIDPNAKAIMGFDHIEWSDPSLIIDGYASVSDYASNSDTSLASFKCIVDKAATGVLSIGFSQIEIGSCRSFEVFSELFDVVSDDIIVFPYVLGDIDDDYMPCVIDATFIHRYSAGLYIPISEDILYLCGDVDGDEEVGVLDATYIQRYDAGFNTPYPIGEPIA